MRFEWSYQGRFYVGSFIIVFDGYVGKYYLTQFEVDTKALPFMVENIYPSIRRQ